MAAEEASAVIARDHKLCGYLTTILTHTNTTGSSSNPVQPGTILSLFSRGPHSTGFKSPSGLILSPPKNPPPISQTPSSPPPPTPPKKPKKATDCWSLKTKRKRKKNKDNEINNHINNNTSNNKSKPAGVGSGGGNGVTSVVNQIKTLVNQKCVRIVARVVGVLSSESDKDEIRVVVLVDVYLPVALWNYGWQFPRSGTTAAAFFRHLSCDWKERKLILMDGYNKSIVGDEKGLWNLPDCHVLGCKRHSNSLDSTKKKGFDLHEIFKSLPSLAPVIKPVSTTIMPEDMAAESGIWDLTDDVLLNILSGLSPKDLVRVSVLCRHLRFLCVSIMPCIKLKLFPHQQAAVEWMVQREQKVATLVHPMYLDFRTEDGFAFFINIVSGELVTGSAPTIRDFRGGLFCDEPGLGKTITALSLIVKTQGVVACAPEGAEVIYSRNGDQKCGSYDCSGSRYSGLSTPSPGLKCENQNDRRGQFSPDELIPKDYSTPKRPMLSSLGGQCASPPYSCPERLAAASLELSESTPAPSVVHCTRSLNRVKKNLINRIESTSGHPNDTKVGKNSGKRKHASNIVTSSDLGKPSGNFEYPSVSKKQKTDSEVEYVKYDETWVQCDDCGKWRKLYGEGAPDSRAAWFCSLNSDPQYQSCSVPEEEFDYQPLTYLPGFCSKETFGELPQNVAFFISVLKEHLELFNEQTRKALKWLARLPSAKLSDMETVGLIRPGQVTTKEASGYHRIFRAFGLIKRNDQGSVRWSYPKGLDNLVFDLPALRTALCEPLDSYRMYLSKATLIVVPSNLVDHWKTQIEKHVRLDRLQVFVWTDHKKPSVHNLAWDYDIVITTFSRLSAEWNPHRRSVLMQVHWMRVILDEGHTLGSSINLTNKMQMAVSLCASSRWILTGTPTPNTPTSQVSHLQPMLKFLHDEAYGESHKNWETGVLKPFEAEMEEGKMRLLNLLNRCMISARKADLACIPPCIKKTTYVNFTKTHAKSYNELVVTVRRNILMADWNDPSHTESLLNPKQWKFRSATIRNVRLSCCVAGHINFQEAGEDIQEAMDILVQNGVDPLSQEYALIKYNLTYGGNCQRCDEWCRLPIVTPCAHILCLDCVALDSERCALPGCGFQYEMQSPEKSTRPENPNPKWPVPKDLIELQPSYKQDNWDADWELTMSSKVEYLIQRLKDIQAATNVQMDCSTSEGNCSVGSHDINPSQEQLGPQSGDSSKAPVEKVIIFSQFLEHIHIIKQQLGLANIKYVGMFSPMNAINKKKSLAVFQRDPSCMALVMDGSAALGLDLSFVTYVFLMEPIWDRSMEEQVISRAHRMGAVRPIHVETLAMRGTIEEQMLEFLQNADECRRLLKEEHENADDEGARGHRSLHEFAERNYLARLSMVRTEA